MSELLLMIELDDLDVYTVHCIGVRWDKEMLARWKFTED